MKILFIRVLDGMPRNTFRLNWDGQEWEMLALTCQDRTQYMAHRIDVCSSLCTNLKNRCLEAEMIQIFGRNLEPFHNRPRFGILAFWDQTSEKWVISMLLRALPRKTNLIFIHRAGQIWKLGFQIILETFFIVRGFFVAVVSGKDWNCVYIKRYRYIF